MTNKNLGFTQVPFQRDADGFCSCGRIAEVHCPTCGSLSRFAKKANSIKCQINMAEMTFAVAQGYICRRCGADYNELDLQECHAPPISKSLGDSYKRGGSGKEKRKSTEDAAVWEQRRAENPDLPFAALKICERLGLQEAERAKVVLAIPMGLAHSEEELETLAKQVLDLRPKRFTSASQATLQEQATLQKFATPQEEQAAEQGDGLCHCEADFTAGGRVCMKCGKPRTEEIRQQIQREELGEPNANNASN